MELLGNLRAIFSHNLKHYRELRGWTQHDLGAAANIKTPTLRGYEQQTRWPDPEEIDALAEALGVPSWKLFTQTSGNELTAEQVFSAVSEALNAPGFSAGLKSLLDGALAARKRDK